MRESLSAAKWTSCQVELFYISTQCHKHISRITTLATRKKQPITYCKNFGQFRLTTWVDIFTYLLCNYTYVTEIHTSDYSVVGNIMWSENNAILTKSLPVISCINFVAL